MKATVVSTGEELIRGRTVDSNASFLAAELTRQGFDVHRLLVVGDAPDMLKRELGRCARDSALIVVTGGLGPTADDRARGAIAEVAGCELAEDEDSRRHVVERLRSFGRQPSDGHLRQASFPCGSRVFPNPRGTARGFACRAGEAWVIALPGVPGEMRPMFLESVVPFLLQELCPAGYARVETVSIFPASESEVDERIHDLTGPGRNPSVGITVRNGVVSVSLRAHADDEAKVEALVGRDLEVLKERFGDRIFSPASTVAEALAEQLGRQGLTIGVAESVTGGLMGDMLVDVPGISRHLLGDVVAYSDEVKVRQLGVPRELIEKHGAVSPEVAESMASGVCAAVGSEVGVSTTGIAGPAGATPEKPVGLVYVGVCVRGDVRSVRLNLRGDRWQIKDRAAKHALNLARLALLWGLDYLAPEHTM